MGYKEPTRGGFTTYLFTCQGWEHTWGIRVLTIDRYIKHKFGPYRRCAKFLLEISHQSGVYTQLQVINHQSPNKYCI